MFKTIGLALVGLTLTGAVAHADPGYGRDRDHYGIPNKYDRRDDRFPNRHASNRGNRWGRTYYYQPARNNYYYQPAYQQPVAQHPCGNR